MDEGHLSAALRYLALNPVKAGLVARAQDWLWSSTGALVAGRSTRHVDVAPALVRTSDFATFLAVGEARWRALLGAESVGRPVGAADWIAALEARLGAPVTPQRRGPKVRTADEAEEPDQLTLLP